VGHRLFLPMRVKPVKKVSLLIIAAMSAAAAPRWDTAIAVRRLLQPFLPPLQRWAAAGLPTPASSIPGWVKDGCNVDTGLGTTGSACTDHAALVNSFLSCATVGGACEGATLWMDVGTGLSAGVVCGTSPACVIDGNGTAYSGFFSRAGVNLIPISSNFAVDYGSFANAVLQPTNPATTPPTQAGWMKVRNIHLNGNRPNSPGNCVTGNTACVEIFLYGLAEALVENVTVSNYPSYAVLFWNNADFKAIHNTINGPGVTLASTDGIHFVGPIGSGHVEGNTINNTGDDAMCACAPEFTGGNIGPVTLVGNIFHGDTQAFRVYNSVSIAGANGPQWTVGPIVVDAWSGDVNPKAGEHGFAFDWIGPSNACSSSTTYDTMTASVSNVTLSGAYYGMFKISCRWGPISIHNVIGIGADSTINSAPFIQFTGDAIATSVDIDHSGWEMTPTQNNNTAYFIEQGGLIQRIRIADPLCITQYNYNPGTPPCQTIIHTPTGGPTTSYIEWADPANGIVNFAAQYSGAPNTAQIMGAENFIATPTINCSSAIASKSNNTAGSFTGSTASSCTITAGGSALANTGWTGTLYDATAGAFIPPDPTAPYSTTTALFTGTIASGHKFVYNLKPF
jgi:hypothetical protein